MHDPSSADVHPSIVTIARWLTGRLEHDELLGVVAPHLFARCPDCGALAEELERRRREVGHWDALVAATEHQEALGLLPMLDAGPLDERLRLVEQDENLQFWGLCHLLVAKSREAAATNPATALDRARLAVRISRHLDPAYDPAWVADLRARAAAALGNARRALGELHGAEDAFLEAEELLAAGTGSPAVAAEVLALVALLRFDQGHAGDAMQLAREAAGIYRQADEPARAGVALLDLAERAAGRDEPAWAAALLREAARLLAEVLEAMQPKAWVAAAEVAAALAELESAAAEGRVTPAFLHEVALRLRAAGAGTGASPTGDGAERA